MSFARLQQQAQAYSGFAERGAEQIQNFDTDKLMVQGQQAAYRQGHQVMERMVGQEVLQGLERGLPPLLRGGKAAVDRARGLPTTREEAQRRAGRRPEQPVGDDENLPQGREEPPAAPSYEEAISSQARTAADRIRRPGGAPTQEGDLSPMDEEGMGQRITNTAPEPEENIERPAQPPEQEPYETQPERPTRPAPEPPESELDRATRRLNNFEEQDRQAQAEPTARVTQPTPDQARQLAGDDKDKPPSYDDDADEAEQSLKKVTDVGDDIEKAEVSLAPEEEVAAAVPGVGELLEGLLAIGGAIAGGVEAAKASSDSAPKQPQGPVAPQLAFSSAPVIDSDDYHSR